MIMESVGLNKFGIFLFTIIYVIVITGVTAMFSGADSSTIPSSAFATTPMEQTRQGNSDILSFLVGAGGTILNFLSMLWSIMSLQIPYVPAVIGFFLAIPVWLFLLVIIDYFLDAIKSVGSVLPW